MIEDQLIKFLEEHKDLSWELNGTQYEILERAIREFYECDFCGGVCKCMLRQKNGVVENNFTGKG